MNERTNSTSPDKNAYSVDTALYQRVHALPKIELHRHLEGAVRLETLVDIARTNKIEMPEYEVETLRPFVQMMPEEKRSMQNFLAKFKTIRQFFLSDEVIRRITHEAVEDAANDNIRYMELRFTPVALSAMSKSRIYDVVQLVCETVNIAAKQFNIDVRLIVSMNRHESIEVGEEALDAALSHREKGVVAIDLAGRETQFPATLFSKLFHRAKSENMPFTIHAGEWDGPQSVWDAVGNLGAPRIGHGIRVLEDGGMAQVLAQHDVVLEVCPTSNIHSGIFPDYKTHPLLELIDRGLKVTINTDDPLISGITLTDELARCIKFMGMSFDDLKTHTLTAAASAFLPDDERQSLVAQFKQLFTPPTEE